ncbi:IS110 family transposase, partial [Pseudonocardia ailaonensis]|uniref:IS110 family transposase n=1 Tax=Pseudonocardia ailaonensis TaxID=367279 RepID=UPI0031E0C4FE
MSMLTEPMEKSRLAEIVDIVIGVDTHTDTHTAAAVIATTGVLVATVTVSADADGYGELVEFADTHAGLRAWAIEGTGGYGAGLARHLADADELVVELDRPGRPPRRGGRKSDPLDAARGAREALSRTRLAQPKTGQQRAALQNLLTVRRGAVEAGADAQRQLRALVVTAPEQVRARFRGKSIIMMVSTAAGLRPHTAVDDVHVFTAMTMLKALAKRIKALQAEANEHQTSIRAIVRSWRPDLLALPGVGPVSAAMVLAAWSHAGRCRDHGAFAMLAGTAPVPASSGKTVRYRLNRAGDRRLNRALHTIAVSRMRHDPDTRTYVQRRRADGKTDPEIRRCLKRYITRQ